jgi:hypothetical protein
LQSFQANILQVKVGQGGGNNTDEILPEKGKKQTV